MQNPVQRVHAGGCFERNRVQGKNSKSTLITSTPKKTAQCINTGLSLMGHTGLELCAKTTGNTPLCEEGGAKSGAVVADEVLESIVDNWQHLPEHIKLAIQALVKTA